MCVPVSPSVVRRKSESRSRGSMSAFTALPLTVNARAMDTGPPLLWARRAARRKGRILRGRTRRKVSRVLRRLPPEPCIRPLQVRNVLRQVLDIGFGQRAGDARHVACVVGALACLEVRKLF